MVMMTLMEVDRDVGRDRAHVPVLDYVKIRTFSFVLVSCHRFEAAVALFDLDAPCVDPTPEGIPQGQTPYFPKRYDPSVGP